MPLNSTFMWFNICRFFDFVRIFTLLRFDNKGSIKMVIEITSIYDDILQKKNKRFLTFSRDIEMANWCEMS